MNEIHMVNIGVMCGRLSKQIDNTIQAFPVYSWKDEFKQARIVGFDCIEWLIDSEKNPIFDNKKEMERLSKEFDIKINSICCDYFMNHLLFDESKKNIEKNLKFLKKIIDSCHTLGIKIIEIPLVDSSSLKTKKNKNDFKNNMEEILLHIEKNNMYLTLEMDLKPLEFNDFLSSFKNIHVGANYDTGNSTSLGYDVDEELSKIGKFIKNIHIKDRLIHGNTVKLGTGNTDFDKFFKKLSEINYAGDLIIQGARLDNVEKPITTCSNYLKFTNQYVHKYLNER